MKNVTADSHIHSKFSWDCKVKIQDIVTRAENLGIDYIAITDHVEFSNQPVKEVIHRIKTRNELIDKIQEDTKVKIIKGIEVSEPHIYREEVCMLNSISDLDYILGSIHHILGLSIGKMAHVKNIRTYYLESLLKMVECGNFDTVAHLDYLKKYLASCEFDQDLIDAILEKIIEKDLILEINTKGYKRCNEAYPNINILKRYQELGGKKVIYGSDAHDISELYEGMDKAHEEFNDFNFQEGIVIKRRFRSL